MRKGKVKKLARGREKPTAHCRHPHPPGWPTPRLRSFCSGNRFAEESPIGPRLGQVTILDQSATVWAGSRSPE